MPIHNQALPKSRVTSTSIAGSQRLIKPRTNYERQKAEILNQADIMYKYISHENESTHRYTTHSSIDLKEASKEIERKSQKSRRSRKCLPITNTHIASIDQSVKTLLAMRDDNLAKQRNMGAKSHSQNL
jgi:hypothetical protein